MDILNVANLRFLALSGPALAAAFLSGCEAGLDAPTRYAPQDTVAVFVPPPDSVVPVNVVPAIGAPPGMLYPRLHPGDKWIFSQKGEGYGGATLTLEIAGDSVYGEDSVYVQTLHLYVPLFYTSYGDTVRNFRESGRLYLRKTDQEVVHDTIATLADIHYIGESVSSAYWRIATTTSVLAGALPDSLRPGAAWTLAAQRHATDKWGWDGDTAGVRDTTRLDTVDYSVRASPLVKVKAGTFAVLGIDWATRGSENPVTAWYAPAAKSLIREIDGEPATADTTELESYTVE